MLSALYGFILLLPLPMIVVLAVARSRRWRRWAYLMTCFSALVAFLILVMFGWVVPKLSEDLPPFLRGVPTEMFAGPLRTFLRSGWLMAAYALAVVVGGYSAYRRAGGWRAVV